MSNWYKQRVVIFLDPTKHSDIRNYILTDSFRVTGEVTELQLDNWKSETTTMICINTDETFRSSSLDGPIFFDCLRLYLKKFGQGPFQLYKAANDSMTFMGKPIEVSIFPLVGITPLPLPIEKSWRRDFVYSGTRDVLELFKKRVVITFDSTKLLLLILNICIPSKSLRTWLKKVNETGKIEGVVDYVYVLKGRIEIGVKCNFDNERLGEIILKRIDSDKPMWLSEITHIYRFGMEDSIYITSIVLQDEMALGLLNKRFKRVASRDVFTVVAKYLM